MISYYDANLSYPSPRLFPYDPGDDDQSGYVDFTKTPELIETVLEDFRPYAHQESVKSFYRYLRWVNGPDSHLCTCDCAMRSPNLHSDTNTKHRLRLHGRVFVLYRDLRLNCSSQHVAWLTGGYFHYLEQIHPELSAADAVLGLTRNPSLHVDLSNGKWHENGEFEEGYDDPGRGEHLMFTFFAYGNTEEQCFANFGRCIEGMRYASEKLSDDIETTMHGN